MISRSVARLAVATLLLSPPLAGVSVSPAAAQPSTALRQRRPSSRPALPDPVSGLALRTAAGATGHTVTEL